ncbi:MAG TPA: TadE/TadG family type IV pilus assembly protein [Terriglobia bacterium]|nr:TadE/TadG family type IV pilus assembly protein [Terriglobia bacterium]
MRSRERWGSSNGRETAGEFQPFINQWVQNLRNLVTSDSGAEVFEFAVVVPLVLTLVLGIVSIGRAYNVYATITRAAREGARYAVLPSSVAAGNTFADTTSASCTVGTNAYNKRVVPALKADNLDPANVQNYCQKTVWLENTYPKQCGVQISFNYPVEVAIPFITRNMSTLNIYARAQMRLENQSAGGNCP